MARTTKKGNPSQRSGKAKPAKSVPRKKGAPARPAARKAPPKPAKKASASTRRPAAKGRGDKGHEARMEDVRRRVARRRPGMAPMVNPQQQDPSIVPPPAPPVPPVDQLRQNWGDTKEKAVTRMDKPTNWFRQAPKPPSK